MGTDHGTAGPVFLAGTPIKASLKGEPTNLTDLVDGDIKPQFDFRQVYASILDQWLDIPSTMVLGEKFESLDLVYTGASADVTGAVYQACQFMRSVFHTEAGKLIRSMIPDYALLTKKSRNGIAAVAMLKAKFNVVSEMERKDSLDEASTYPKPWAVKRMVLVAQQDVWIYFVADDVFARKQGAGFATSDLGNSAWFAMLLEYTLGIQHKPPSLPKHEIDFHL